MSKSLTDPLSKVEEAVENWQLEAQALFLEKNPRWKHGATSSKSLSKIGLKGKGSIIVACHLNMDHLAKRTTTP